MAKPTVVPTWSTNANYAASTQPWASTPTKVQPPSGVQAEGLNPEDPTVAQYENWLRNAVGQWCSFLDGLFDSSTNLTLPSGALYKRGPLWRKLPCTAGQWTKGAFGASYIARRFSAGVAATAVNDKYEIPIPLLEGERLLQVKAWVFNNATDVLTLKMFYDDGTVFLSQLGSTQTSSNHAFAQEILTVSGLTEVCSSANERRYYALLECTAFGSQPTIGGIAYQTDVP